MISYGDMLDTLEKNEPQNPPTVVEKKGGNNTPENKGGEPEMLGFFIYYSVLS